MAKRTKGSSLRDTLNAAWDVLLTREGIAESQYSINSTSGRAGGPSEASNAPHRHLNQALGTRRIASTGTDDAPSDEQCDYLYWKVDIPVCRAIEARRGKRAAALCYHSATARYASCLRGTPIPDLPPLSTWNN